MMKGPVPATSGGHWTNEAKRNRKAAFTASAENTAACSRAETSTQPAKSATATIALRDTVSLRDRNEDSLSCCSCRTYPIAGTRDSYIYFPMMAERRTDPARIFRALVSMRHARRSLSGKLMIVMLATTAIALAAAGTALLLSDLNEDRASLADDLSTEAGIISLAVQPALSFNDRELAQRTLNAL